MFSRSQFMALVLAVLATFALAGVAEAGWVTIKNDSNKPLVVQEFIIVNGKKVTGKPNKLLPGESFREFQNTGGVRNYEILDASNNSLGGGPLNCRGDSQTFSVTISQGKAIVLQVPEPKKP